MSLSDFDKKEIQAYEEMITHNLREACLLLNIRIDDWMIDCFLLRAIF